MNKKGISMISLVIVIIVIIILVGIATTAGYRYINRINDLKAEALGTTIGDAALRRQNDVTSGVSDRFYDGYLFDINLANYSLIEFLPKEDANTNVIPDCLEEEGALWYLFDAESATNLGVDKTEEFLTRNVAYYVVTPDTDEDLVRVVLADYTSGQGYYVRMPASVMKTAIVNSASACPNSPNGMHKFTVATCTEDSECIYNCGTNEGPRALGHNWVESTCTADGYCARCGVINPDDLAKGHLLISNDDIDDDELIAKLAATDSYMIVSSSDSDEPAWVADVNKHWNECKRCGIRLEEEVHTRAFRAIDDETHQETCSKCGWESVVSKHKLTHTSITDNTHKVECSACMYESIHRDTGWINGYTSEWPDGHPIFHFRICNVNEACNDLSIDVNGVDTKVIYKEAHYDHNNDYLCDVCGRDIDYTPPANFGYEDYGSYGKVYQATTSTITLEAFTVDLESKVTYYQFGILNSSGTIDWRDDVVNVSNATDVARYTFNNLKANTQYTFYVRAADRHGNINSPYKIVGATVGFPNFENIRNVPDTFKKPPVNIGVVPVETDIPNIRLEYRQNEGAWQGPYPPASSSSSLYTAMNNLQIELNEEKEVIDFKFIDDEGNESRVWTYTVECVDATPPTVTVVPKQGDDYTQSALRHQATITLKDTLSGIDKDTEVRYAWSTSNTVAPTEYETVRTENLDIAERVSFDVVTPEGLNGEYYIWVLKGIKDAAGNETTENVVCNMRFVIDDEPAVLSNIKMLDVTPSPEVPDEHLFVKTGGEVTVTFTASKDLAADPIVRINGVNVDSITHSGRNWTCKITIDSSFKEGILELYIGDVVSINGRVSTTTYSNDDLVEGPVFYDKTLPVVNYIKKRS